MKFLVSITIMCVLVLSEACYSKEISDVAYANLSKSQVCNIYMPNDKENNGVIILVHGGGFAFGTQNDELIKPVIVKAIERGYCVVAADYRKSSEAIFPAAIANIKALVRWVKANACQYNFNISNITIWGESAGAYLSVMTALTPEAELLNGNLSDNLEYSSSVRNLVSFYAPIEFYTMDIEFEELGLSECANHNNVDSFESKFLGQSLSKDKNETYKTYWENYFTYDVGLKKVWIQAGSNDRNVPYTQSKNLAEKLSEKLTGKVHYNLIYDAGHMDQAFYTDKNLNAIFDYLTSQD